VAQDTASTSNTTRQPAGAPAARLQEIRARVSELHRRIKNERDPAAVTELRAEVGKLTEVLTGLVDSPGTVPMPAAKAALVVWPRDLSAEPSGTADWGADPAEVAGG
jgi:hypothetical protein